MGSWMAISPLRIAQATANDCTYFNDFGKVNRPKVAVEGAYSRPFL